MNEELKRLIDGGEIVLAELFSQHRDRLSRLIDFRLDSRLQSRVDSEDVLQEAYIEISRRLSDFLTEPEVSLHQGHDATGRNPSATCRNWNRGSMKSG